MYRQKVTYEKSAVVMRRVATVGCRLDPPTKSPRDNGLSIIRLRRSKGTPEAVCSRLTALNPLCPMSGRQSDGSTEEMRGLL